MVKIAGLIFAALAALFWVRARLAILKTPLTKAQSIPTGVQRATFISIAILSILGPAILIYGGRDLLIELQRAQTWLPTTATVAHLEDAGIHKGRTQYRVAFTFTDQNGETRSALSTDRLTSPPTPGSNVAIHYNPENSTEANLNNLFYRFGMPSPFTLVGLVLLAFAVMAGREVLRLNALKTLTTSNPLKPTRLIVFPHAVHLDPAGVGHPEKDKVKLGCEACHQPDASRRGFEPVSMARHCQDCHRLEFEPAVTARQVPHGRPAEAMTVVGEFYANLALNGVRDSFEKAFGVPGEGLLRRPGEPGDAGRRATLAMAAKKAAHVSEENFEIRLCRTCHEVQRSDGDRGTERNVAQVRLGHAWMPGARFDHASHAQSRCSSCHDVSKSKRSADVAMPAIEGCRECHGGSRPVAGKVTSNCLLCHGFHDPRHAWDPQFKPRSATRVAGGTPRAR